MTMPANFQPIDFVPLLVSVEKEDLTGAETKNFGHADVSFEDGDVNLSINNNHFSLKFVLSINSDSARQLAKALLKQADLCDQQAKKGGAA